VRGLYGFIQDAFDFAAVEVEFAGDGALAVAGVVPGPHRLLDAWCLGRRGWCVAVHDLHRVAHVHGWGGRGAGPGLGPDERHQEFERPGQGQGGPGADQGTDWTVAKAVRQVGAGRGQDAGAEALPRQGWYRPVAAVGVEDEHAGRQDQAVDGKREQACGHAGLAVGAGEFAGMAVGDHRGDRCDRGDGGSGGDPDEPVSQANSSPSSARAPSRCLRASRA
jgi:hypothetical protein